VETVQDSVTDDIFKKHLEGEVGLGIPMLMENGKCFFGVIDIDYHSEDSEADFASLEYKIDVLELPLVLCRSKRGGAHLYLFCSNAQPAKAIINKLKSWAGQLGFSKSEIFPKQIKIGPGETGNWINLPYFNYIDTVRYGIKAGEKIFGLLMVGSHEKEMITSRDKVTLELAGLILGVAIKHKENQKTCRLCCPFFDIPSREHYQSLMKQDY